MLKCKAIKDAVAKYNEDDNLSKDEADLTDQLNAYWYKKAKHSAEDCLVAVLLVADWGALVHFRFRDRVRHAQRLRANLQAFDRLSDLTIEDWVRNPEALNQASAHLTDDDFLKPDGTHGRQLCFVSKLIHWCFNPVFPIWDKNARAALSPNVREDTNWKCYRAWARDFHREMMQHRECCLIPLQGDDRSIVRTLDKALFIIGGDKLRKRRTRLHEATKKHIELRTRKK